MIHLLYDLATGIARLASPAAIMTGADVPVRVVFATAPSDVTGLKLALGSIATPPALLAETAAFLQESDREWTATLDASDTRLVNHSAGKSVEVSVELVAMIDGNRRVAPHLPATAQPAFASA